MLGLTQEELADRAGVAVRTLKSAEAGEPIAQITAQCLTTVLGLPYASILTTALEEVERRLSLAGYAALANRDPLVGRTSELGELVEAVSADEGVAFCVTGPSGIGKSTLVRQLVAEVRGAFPEGVVWVEASELAGRGRRLAVQGDLAEALGFQDVLPDAGRVTEGHFDHAFATRLFSRRRLLILNDARYPGVLEAFRGHGGTSWIVATSAHRLQVSAPWRTLEVGPLPSEDALRLLSRGVAPARLAAEPEATEHLLRVCGGSVACLRSAESALAKSRYLRVSDAVDELGAYLQRSEQAALWRARLTDEAAAAAMELRVFGGSPFSIPWACVATGLEQRDVRALLSELHDLYLLEEVHAEGEDLPLRFQFPTGATAALGGPRPATPEQVARSLSLRPQWSQGDDMDALPGLSEELPLWRTMLDAAALLVLGSVSSQPVSALENLPRPVGHVPPSAAILLGDPLMHVLVRFFAPRQSPVWIAAALALAREQDDQRSLGSLGALYGWWWFYRVGDTRMLATWTLDAARCLRGAGPSADAVLMGLLGADCLWIHRGIEAAASLFEEVLASCRAAAPSWGVRCSALIGAGVSLALRNQPEAARALFLEAEALVLGDTSKAQLVRAVVALDLAVCDRLLGKPLVDPDGLATALQQVQDLFLHHYPFPRFRMGVLARWLGVAAPTDGPTAREALLGAPPSGQGDALVQLLQLCGELSVPVEGVASGEMALRTPLGRISRIGMTIMRSDSLGLQLHLELLSPVDGLQELLAGDGASLALALVEHTAPPGHALHKALADLAGRGGLAVDWAGLSAP